MRRDQMFEKAYRIGLAHVSGSPDGLAVEIEGRLGDGELAAAVKNAEILGELSGVGFDPFWAGAYSFGDGSGMNIRMLLAPAGAHYSWNGCLGLYDINYGDVERVVGRSIYLKLAICPKRNKSSYLAGFPRYCMSDKWILVDWGTERFLIPSVQMIAFCNAVNDGYSDIFCSYATRSGYSSVFEQGRPDVSLGAPEVPPEFEPFLLEAPIQGMIVASKSPTLVGTYGVKGARKHEQMATVNRGRADGLLPGMLLYGPESAVCNVGEVVDVWKDGATLRFRFAVDENLRATPQVGWSLSTRHPASRMGVAL